MAGHPSWFETYCINAVPALVAKSARKWGMRLREVSALNRWARKYAKVLGVPKAEMLTACIVGTADKQGLNPTDLMDTLDQGAEEAAFTVFFKRTTRLSRSTR